MTPAEIERLVKQTLGRERDLEADAQIDEVVGEYERAIKALHGAIESLLEIIRSKDEQLKAWEQLGATLRGEVRR